MTYINIHKYLLINKENEMKYCVHSSEVRVHSSQSLNKTSHFVFFSIEPRQDRRHQRTTYTHTDTACASKLHSALL